MFNYLVDEKGHPLNSLTIHLRKHMNQVQKTTEKELQRGAKHKKKKNECESQTRHTRVDK